MFHLFGKKGAALEADLTEYQRKRNWAGLAKAYYRLGAEAMDNGNPNRAVLWLNRADTIYSADDAVYTAVGEKLINDCSERIARLECEPLLYNTVPAKVEEMAEALGDVKIRVWGLLSLARLVKLGKRVAGLPGCEVFGRLGWAVDTVLKSLQEPPTEEEFNGLRDMNWETARNSGGLEVRSMSRAARLSRFLTLTECRGSIWRLTPIWTRI